MSDTQTCLAAAPFEACCMEHRLVLAEIGWHNLNGSYGMRVTEARAVWADTSLLIPVLCHTHSALCRFETQSECDSEELHIEPTADGRALHSSFLGQFFPRPHHTIATLSQKLLKEQCVDEDSSTAPIALHCPLTFSLRIHTHGAIHPTAVFASK
jgi:hypothetical protein